MKVEEARQKWCPMVRIVIGPCDAKWQNTAYTNRTMDVKKGWSENCCIGPDCMMWAGNGEQGECGLVFDGSNIDVTNHY